LLDYTFKTGETSAIKKVIQFIDSQVQVKDTLIKKTKEKPFQVGGDTTYDSERKVGE